MHCEAGAPRGRRGRSAYRRDQRVRLPDLPNLRATCAALRGGSLTHIQVLDVHQEGNSPIHRRDARVKLVLALAFIVAITALPAGAWLSYLLVLLAIGFVLGVSRISPALVLKRSLVAIPFAMAALTLIFTREGTTVVAVELAQWIVSISYEGIVAFSSILTKAWLSVLVATMLVTSTSFPDLVSAMRSLRVPKVLVSVISFMYRYIFIIADEALRLHRAREARSASPKGAAQGSIIWKTRVLGGMIGSLFLRSYERSERIHAAMLSRGFDGDIRAMRSRLLSPGDSLIMGAFLIYLLAVLLSSRIERGM
jgi:cobalt/nickel transport system permease protein